MEESERKACLEFLANRLYYVPIEIVPVETTSSHYFSIDRELVYWNFYLDFGPINLGQAITFFDVLNSKLRDSRLAMKTIYFCSGTHPHKQANAAFLICAWAMFHLRMSPEEAFACLSGSVTLTRWHDATPGDCPFKLTILDTLKGFHKARVCRFFDLESFNLKEYEYFEGPQNGDLTWCINGKFIAFAGPQVFKEDCAGGYKPLSPENFIPYFRSKNVSLVVRLNRKYYDARRFTNSGIQHAHLYFPDGSNPPLDVLDEFLRKCEQTSGAVAVHCKAGLGRTGTCIAAYMMKHYRFTAVEAIGWLRVVRPGSVIGPQQQFVQDLESRLWMDGEVHRQRLTDLFPMYHTEEAKKCHNENIGIADITDSLESLSHRSSRAKERFDDVVPSEEPSQGDLLRLRRVAHCKAEAADEKSPTGQCQSPTSHKPSKIVAGSKLADSSSGHNYVNVSSESETDSIAQPKFAF